MAWKFRVLEQSAIESDAISFLQMQLLQGLGIQNTLITDGKTPLNLYQASQGTVPLAH